MIALVIGTVFTVLGGIIDWFLETVEPDNKHARQLVGAGWACAVLALSLEALIAWLGAHLSWR